MSLQKNDLLIRRGLDTDLQVVYSLVKELAVYEKAAHAVTATLEDYTRDFNAGIFEVLVAETDGQVIGMALYYMSYSTWKGRMLYLEDFVVLPEYRKLGAGQLLFDAYLNRARELECRLVKWQVLDWNEPALAFYRKNQAIIETDWWSGKIFLTSPQAQQ